MSAVALHALAVALSLTAQARRDLADAIESHLAGDIAQAENGYRSVLARHPDFAPARLYLSETLWLRGEREAARRQLSRASEPQPELLAVKWLRWRFGGPPVELDENEEDESVLRRLQSIYPFPQQRFVATGTPSMILLSIGRVERAVEDFRRASALDPGDVELHRRLGQAFFEAGASVASAEAYERVVASEADDVPSWKQLGSSYLMLQRWESSMRAFDRALEREPGDVGVLLARGYARERLTRFDAALDDYRTAARLAPRAFQPHLRMGRAHLALHDLDRAEDDMKEAARLDPDAAEPLGLLGEIYLKKNQPERALEPLRKAASLDPDFLDAHYHLAQAYRRIGRTTEAREAIATYEKLKEKVRSRRRRPR